MVNLGAIPALVKYLSDNNKSGTTYFCRDGIDDAAGALWGLADAHHEAIVAAGAILQLARLLMVGRDEDQEQAAGALATLAADHPEAVLEKEPGPGKRGGVIGRLADSGVPAATSRISCVCIARPCSRRSAVCRASVRSSVSEKNSENSSAAVRCDSYLGPP